jgi:hypothetical protein
LETLFLSYVPSPELQDVKVQQNLKATVLVSHREGVVEELEVLECTGTML